MRRVDKPWGYELIWAETPRYVAKILHINKGFRLSRQYHEVKVETLYLEAGRAALELGSEPNLRVVTLEHGDTHHIAPTTVHRLIAIETSRIFEVSTPELDDVVRLDDEYGRAGTSEP